MGRAEKRRLEREKVKKEVTYNLTAGQIAKLKQDATDEAISTAFILMLGLPIMVLNDKFSKIYRKENRLENFMDELLELYDSFNKGYLTLDDILETIKEETGVDVVRRGRR